MACNDATADIAATAAAEDTAGGSVAENYSRLSQWETVDVD